MRNMADKRIPNRKRWDLRIVVSFLSFTPGRVGIGSKKNSWESRIPGDRRLTVTGFFSLRFKEEQIGFPLRTFLRTNPTINITDVVPGPYEPTSHKLATRAIFTKKGNPASVWIPFS
jgi:hypothetical protein